MRQKKIFVAHFGKQHSFRLAEALKKDDYQIEYITTVYLKKNNFTGIAKRFLRGSNLKRVNSRRCDVLEDRQVKQFCEIGGLINLILIRLDKSKKIYIKWSRFTAKRFAKRVARYAIKNNPDAVIMYDTNAKVTFELLKKKSPDIKRILDVSSASHRYMKKIYEEDMIHNPRYSGSIIENCAYFWDEKTLERYDKEIELTDYFIVPSDFVKESLLFHNVDPSKIFICSYGVDTNRFIYSEIKESTTVLNCVYVGGVNQRKGISYLLDAFKNFSSDQVSLTIVGNFDKEDINIKEYLNKYNFVGSVTNEEVGQICSKADIMVFPSLSEGLSLAVLEGLGCGLPVIATRNSGYTGIIKDEYNGFIIDAGNSKVITEKINWFLSNKDRIPEMRRNARDTALNFTWDTYNERMSKIIKRILEEK